MTEIRLTWVELAEAAREGTQRRIRALARQSSATRDFTGDLWGNDIEAVAAELAFAKAADLYWAPQATPDWDGDVGSWQIRRTVHANGRLIIYREDSDLARFMLLVGRAPTFRICGWISGRDAKQSEWWSESLARPAFMVPQDALQPFTLDQRLAA